jgi:SAM-dependent methyltransferase
VNANLGARTRRLAAKSLRKSPEPMQDALARGSQRLLSVLHPSTLLPDLVWQSPDIPLPPATTLDDIEACLRTWSINGEPVGHMDQFVTNSLWRFLHTWGMVRDEVGSCLELGANPYFTSFLLDTYTDLEMTYANFYGEVGEMTETLSYVPPARSERLEVKREAKLFDVERDEFPYETGSFDVVCFCETLERLQHNPVAALREVHRVLKPGGLLVLTTPNVARIDNVMATVHGLGIGDSYSGVGGYDRANREYTLHELHRLLTFLGFEVDVSFTADARPFRPERWPKFSQVTPLLEYRRHDLGDHLFVRARSTGTPRPGLPSFLFRNWPDGVIVDYA